MEVYIIIVHVFWLKIDLVLFDKEYVLEKSRPFQNYQSTEGTKRIRPFQFGTVFYRRYSQSTVKGNNLGRHHVQIGNHLVLKMLLETMKLWRWRLHHFLQGVSVKKVHALYSKFHVLWKMATGNFCTQESWKTLLCQCLNPAGFKQPKEVENEKKGKLYIHDMCLYRDILMITVIMTLITTTLISDLCWFQIWQHF